MAKYLVVVESPAKAKTIKKFLGRDYIVKACFGAVRDLPKSEMGVDVEDNFEPKYVVLREERARKAVKEIKEAAATVDKILLASDPDREGEAIAWHVAEILRAGKKTGDKPSERIVFNEITRKSVRDAVKSPRGIDTNLVDAQQARRIVDRLVGYKLSPMLGWVVRKGLSAGRVQSVAVRMVVEREVEIRDFVKEEYWSIHANLLTEREAPFTAALYSRGGLLVRLGEEGQIRTEADANGIVSDLEGAEFKIRSVERKEVRRRPFPPFVTSSLQQEASHKLRMTPAKTMAVAQQLYQGISLGKEGEVGLITYMRTDSTRLSGEALSEVRDYIGEHFEPGMLPGKPNTFRNKKGAQDAHEAIRPSSVSLTPEKASGHLSAEQLDLYTLIWKRFVACQMAPALLDQTTIDLDAKDYVFRSTGSIMKFRGFTILYEEAQEDPKGTTNGMGEVLPEVHEGEGAALDSLSPDQHFTKPPPRYSEASLVRAMEENGIGRPSTYAPTIRTILDREYVARNKGRLVPTELGEQVNEWLVRNFPDILSIDFTARLENNLDNVEEGKQAWRDLMREFYGPFEADLKGTEKRMVTEMAGEDPRCPECDAPVVLKQSWFGMFLGCSRHPECKGTVSIRKNSKPPEPTDETCPECGLPMVIRSGRYGRFMACSGYPKCKVSFNLDKDGKKLAPKEPPRKTDEKCPTCGKGYLLIRKSRAGEEFYGCEKYPKCRFTRPMELDLPCPVCGGALAHKMAKRRHFVGCERYPDCKFTAFGKLDQKVPCPKCGHGWTTTVKPRNKPRVRKCPIAACAHEEEIP